MSEERKYRQPQISQVEELSVKLIALYHELAEKNRQLELSELARKNMFSHITHDLRAPISVIRGAAERLCREAVSAKEQLKLAKIIDSRASALENLVSDLFLSIQIDQPEFSLALSPLDVAPILEEYYISMEESGKLNRREGRISIPDKNASKAYIDPQYFLRVLDNLTSNALRHTGPGDSIELGCRETEGEGGKTVEIYLRDSGAGVPAEDLPYIFDRTFTGAAARTPGKSGGGLGLSISRAIIEKHGGQIRCDSVCGGGATFIIELPSVQESAEGAYHDKRF